MRIHCIVDGAFLIFDFFPFYFCFLIYYPSPPDFDDKCNIWLQPQAFSTLLNFILPVDFLIGEMFWWKERNKAKQSDPDQLWSPKHMAAITLRAFAFFEAFYIEVITILKGKSLQ